jgi:hypothetical protein
MGKRSFYSSMCMMDKIPKDTIYASHASHTHGMHVKYGREKIPCIHVAYVAFHNTLGKSRETSHEENI